MIKKSVKSFIAILIVLFAFSPLMAASAKVTYVKGKVEVKKGNSWVAVKVGDLISESETVSTGYQSEARLNLNGTILAVSAMSRVTIESLKSDANKDTVSVYVDAGATRSKVSHADNKKMDYTTRTAVAVASVRGTDYVQTARGLTICYEGAVAVYSAWQKNNNLTVEEAIEIYEENSTDNETIVVDKTEIGPADANTPAEKISASAPKNAYVVGAGQITSFDEKGKALAPTSQATNKAKKIVSSIKTAAEKENTNRGDKVVDEQSRNAVLTVNLQFDGN